MLSTLNETIQVALFLARRPKAGASALDSATIEQQLPGLGPYVLAHLRIVAFVVLAVPPLAALAGVGMLRGRSWARLAAICLLCLGGVGILVGMFALQRSLGTSFNDTFRGPVAADSSWRQTADQAIATFRWMRAILVLLSVAMAAVLGWLAAKLVLPAAWAEDQAARHSA